MRIATSRLQYNHDIETTTDRFVSMRWYFVLWFLLCLCCFASVARAEAVAQVEALSPMDQARLDAQRQVVRELAALHLGRGFSGDRARDLDTLQLLLDRGVVGQGETAQLQAMGVILGDLLAADLDMGWVVYEDREGRSRALQLGSTRNFLFPITMISRRVDVGIAVDVRALYAKARAEMEPYVLNRYRRPATLP